MKIRYANCWEDAEVVLRALEISPRGRYLLICSAGDIVLSLLSKKPQKIIAVDTNPAQTACLDLRKAAFQCLSYQQVLAFLGITHSTDRICTYHQIRDRLTEKSAIFWDTNHDALRAGIIHAGTTERNFHRFRKWFLPLFMNRAAGSSLFTSTSDNHQRKILSRVTESRRWKLMTGILFSRNIMKTLDLGRTPSFYNEIPDNIGAYVRRNIQRMITQAPIHDNPYLEYIIRGNFIKTRPFYLQEKNFNQIRHYLNRITHYISDIVDYLENTNDTFNGFYFSDIFEYMTDDQCHHVLALAVQHSRPEARIVYWSTLRSRPLQVIGNTHIRTQDDIAQELFQHNRAFFYSDLSIGEVS
ncbi:MAG: DUF3419 family protein [candidate division WOR-3 bacterium]|nr:MAG: DUF3419 family protein [candidate division WOR-3 bacterium]